MTKLRVADADGELLAVEGEWATIVSVKAFAPGQPLSFDLQDDAGTFGIGGKAQGSKRLEDGRFRVKMRLVNLRRDLRERMLALQG